MTDPHVLISGYLDGLLDGQKTEELNNWINADKANARYFAQMCFIHRRVHDVMHGDEVTSLMEVFKSAEQGMADADSADSGVDFEAVSREDLLREVIDQERAAKAKRTAAEAERKASEMLEQSMRQESLKSMMGRGKSANQSQTRHYVIPRPLFYGSIAAVVAIFAFLFWPGSIPKPPVDGTSETPLVEVAVVIEQVDAVWDAGEREIHNGDTIHNEPITLSEGFARLRFASGAEVILEAPCVFEPVSPVRMKFQRGDLWARCEPESSKGFTVESRNARIVDIGTEFGVSVAANGILETQVFDGEIELAAVSNGTIGRPMRLRKGEARRMSADGRNVTEVEANRFRFVRGMSAADRDRVLGYVNSVTSLNPIVYYRFESKGGGVIQNEMAGGYRAHMIGGVELEATGAGAAGRFSGGYLRIGQTSTACRTHLTTPWNAG